LTGANAVANAYNLGGQAQQQGIVGSANAQAQGINATGNAIAQGARDIGGYYAYRGLYGTGGSAPGAPGMYGGTPAQNPNLLPITGYAPSPGFEGVVANNGAYGSGGGNRANW
jgi:hypothetical protein